MLPAALILLQSPFALSSGQARLEFSLSEGAWRMAAFRPGESEPWMRSVRPGEPEAKGELTWRTCRVNPDAARLTGSGPGGSQAELVIEPKPGGAFSFRYRLSREGGYRAASAQEWWTRNGRPFGARLGRLGGEGWSPLDAWIGRLDGGSVHIRPILGDPPAGPEVAAEISEGLLGIGPRASAESQFPAAAAWALEWDLEAGEEPIAEPSTSLPQVLPFEYYTKPLYAFTSGDPEPFQMAWFSGEMEGLTAGGPLGLDLAWGRDGNPQAAAYGLLSWGRRLRQGSWERRGRELTSLLLAGQGRAFDGGQKAFRAGRHDDAGGRETRFWLERSIPFLEEPLKGRAQAFAAQLPAEARPSDAMRAGWELAESFVPREAAGAHGLPLLGAYLPHGSSQIRLGESLHFSRRLIALGREARSASLVRLGAAGIRQSLGFLSFAASRSNGLAALPLSDGLAAAGYDLGRSEFLPQVDGIAGRMAILAHLAYLADDFGDAFELDGTLIGINGVAGRPEGALVSLLRRIPLPYSDQVEARVGSQMVKVSEEASIKAFRLALHNGQVGVEAAPGFDSVTSSAKAEAAFLLPSGVTAPGQSPSGWFAPLGAPEEAPAAVSAGFRLNGQEMPPRRLVHLLTDSAEDWPLRSGGLRSYLGKSLAGGWISTADGGTGRPEPQILGSILSLPFLATGRVLTFEHQSQGRGRIALIRADDGQELDSLPLEERPNGIGVFDLEDLRGQRLRLILVDSDAEGWVQARLFQQA